MKKTLSFLLALALTLALSVPAFAAALSYSSGNASISFSNATTGTGVISGAYFIPGNRENFSMTRQQTVTIHHVPANSQITIANGGATGSFTLNNGVYVFDGEGGGEVNGTMNASQVAWADLYLFTIGTDRYFVKVGGSGSSTAQAATQQQTAVPVSTPASDNTVVVAGQNRTPGQIYTYTGGHLYTVNHGDTLYDLSVRFYGDGSLWRELQRVNQQWLNETKDGIIFVGFNLLIPAELGSVRANIR